MVQVKILSTSDVHGYFTGDDFRRPLQNNGFGLARAATVVEQEKQAATEDLVITIENGDFIQGSPLTDYVEKQASAEGSLYRNLVATVGYEVRILGNHEFNYGRTYLEEVLHDDQTLLNANILDKDTKNPFIGRPYQIFEKGGLKVAVIGVTTQYIPHWEKPENIKGLLFQDPVKIVSNLVADLRFQVDKIVVAYHGGFNRDLKTGQALEPLTQENQGTDLLTIEGVDALVTGHQHRTLAEVVNGKPITQPGYRGDHVGVITLSDQQVAAKTIATATAGENLAIMALAEPLLNRVNQWLDEPVGHVGDNMRITDHFSARLHGHPFTELINRVQMAATGAKISANAIFNDEMRGFDNTVTIRDVMTNYIYRNTLAVVALTGAELVLALEQNANYFDWQDGQPMVSLDYLYPKPAHFNEDIWSGVAYKLDVKKPRGQRISAVMVGGQAIQPEAKYEVVVNNYRAGGAGNSIFNRNQVVREGQTDVAQLIVDYLRQHPKIRIDQPTNIHVVN
ncbi:bifunctional metallophosphatase/5'-nucleotidase [Fructobacillus americanaquae]|uniref:Bifunctional metallophosphatase/5'-nucleotidase n=1 Tax=Fructobacillus americanaquae TaxID=2940302 RepID=A0ABY5C1B5_9LACO|nr:bifunctional metallophosphatase/5'-nucleotidase [Fructobacillus americanaquae]USS91633.1 bifunctional metallophosphatase/5'-nucleotidase [Fructobacillus americanaquae]